MGRLDDSLVRLNSSWSATRVFQVGGDPLINYLWGYFDLQPDGHGSSISGSEAEFWATLYNWWQESFDYAHRQWRSTADAKRTPTAYTFVIAAKIGLGNWMDSAGHRKWDLRWSGRIR
jgi:hypothetical protein